MIQLTGKCSNFNLVSNGAEIIDIGAASSKPGSKLIDPKNLI